MITRAGLVRFWIGTVLIVVCSTVGLGVARTASGEPAPWWIAAGAGVVCLGLCIGLWRRRVADEADAMRVDLPRYEPVSVLVALGLIVDLVLVAGALRQPVANGQLDEFWMWPPVVTIVLGVALVLSLGDYAA